MLDSRNPASAPHGFRPGSRRIKKRRWGSGAGPCREAAMTDETDHDGRAGQGPGRRASPEVQDFLLAEIVRLANWFDVEHGITLSIGGASLSGMLISGRRYFESQAASAAAGAVRGGDDAEIANSYRTMMIDFYTTWAGLYDRPETLPEGTPPPAPSYIHLRNARWFTPAGPSFPAGNGMLWRGRLAAVEGFSLGLLQQA